MENQENSYFLQLLRNNFLHNEYNAQKTIQYIYICKIEIYCIYSLKVIDFLEYYSRSRNIYKRDNFIK